MVVPPWQIAVSAPPTFTVGFGLTVSCLLANAVLHEPPLVVRVNVTGVKEEEVAV